MKTFLSPFWDSFGILRGSLRSLLEAFGNTSRDFGEALGIHGVAFGGHSKFFGNSLEILLVRLGAFWGSVGA